MGKKLHPHQQSNYEPSQEKSGRHTQAKQKNGRQHCVTTRFLGIVFTNSKLQRFAKQPVLASVAGVMVSIVAFQAMDPGSLPGRRTFCNFGQKRERAKTKVLPDLNEDCQDQNLKC